MWVRVYLTQPLQQLVKRGYADHIPPHTSQRGNMGHTLFYLFD